MPEFGEPIDFWGVTTSNKQKVERDLKKDLPPRFNLICLESDFFGYDFGILDGLGSFLAVPRVHECHILPRLSLDFANEIKVVAEWQQLRDMEK